MVFENLFVLVLWMKLALSIGRVKILRYPLVFQKSLVERRKLWAKRKEEEAAQQEAIRECEDQVVQRLVDNQVSISEEERARILEKHERHMVAVENSLTLNKLQQKRMLERRLAEKRDRDMEKLNKKQRIEMKVCCR